MNTITLRTLRTSCPSRYHSSKHSSKSRDSTSKKQYLSLNLPSSSKYLQSHLQRQLRHASTAPSRSLKPSPPSPPPDSISKVNGPRSTLPAPLSLPVRTSSQSAFSYYFSLGKAFAGFYKTGVKNIYYNFRASRPIQARIDNTYKSSLSAAAKSGTLSRSDFQLLVRNWHDVKRVPIFALVFLICGEFTPLVVIAVSNVVPWTCRIPKQIDSDRKKLEQRRAISFRNLTMDPPRERGVERLERMQLLHISWSLGLSSSFWDYLGGKLPGLPTGILRRKVARRVSYLEADDLLIDKWGGVKEMEIEEVKMALIERGFDVSGKKDGDLKAGLSAWLRSREKVPVEKLLLTRPSVWPVRPKV